MTAAVRITCRGTALASCLNAATWDVATAYVNTDNTGEADYTCCCDEHILDAVRDVSCWNPGFEPVEVTPHRGGLLPIDKDES